MWEEVLGMIASLAALFRSAPPYRDRDRRRRGPDWKTGARRCFARLNTQSASKTPAARSGACPVRSRSSAAGRLRFMPDAAGRPEPFTPQTAPAALEDLRARLRATRWPDTPEDAGWSLGTDLAYLRELVAYWADGFDWPAQEAALARLPRFRVALGGLGIHFVHVRSAARAGPVLPLVLSHGWPDSFWRYAKVIPLLTDPGAHGADPADAFDVVVPDMPGYGYSDRPAGPPLDAIAVASLWAELMGVLGYPRFGAAGGDIGSHVSRYLGLDHPGRVVAVHRTDAGMPVFTGDPADLAPEERAWLEGAAAWSDCDGDVERRFTKDEILTNVTLYWLTGTIGSSM